MKAKWSGIYLVIVLMIIFGVCSLTAQDGSIQSKTFSPPTNTPFAIADLSSFEINNFSGSGYVTFIAKDTNNLNQVYRKNIDTGTTTTLSTATSGERGFVYAEANYANSDYVCWYDGRNVTGDEIKQDIYYYKIANSTEYRATSAPEDRTCLTLFENYIVFAEYGSSNPGIYIKNLSTTASPQRIHTFTQNQCINLAIGKYDNQVIVVFEDENGSTADIKTYNISTQTTTTIASSSTEHELYPKIQNGRIYYTSLSRSNPAKPWPKDETYVKGGSLKEYNLSTSSTYTVSTFNDNQFVSALYNPDAAEYVVYFKDDFSGNDEENYLYIYNSSTQSSTQIANANGSGNEIFTMNGCCYGDVIVYSKYVDIFNNGDETVYAYDASSSSTTTITSDTNCLDGSAKILGNTIIWTAIKWKDVDTYSTKHLKGYIIE